MNNTKAIEKTWVGGGVKSGQNGGTFDDRYSAGDIRADCRVKIGRWKFQGPPNHMMRNRRVSLG